MKQEGILCWVTALKAEAKALIERFDLQMVSPRGDFPVYQDKEERRWLIITGIGKENSAAGTEYLYQHAGEPRGVAWLNVGIAGHRELNLGELRWVNRIEEADSGESWYPPRVLRTGSGRASALLTVSEPGDYPEGDTLVDMEASAFYATACQFSTRELVQVLKLVSDNAETSWKKLDKGAVAGWMENRLEEITVASEELLVLSGEERSLHADPVNYQEMLDTWHFTATEQHQLRKLLRRYEALLPVEESAWEECRQSGVQCGSEALDVLRSILAARWMDGLKEGREQSSR